MQLAGSGLGADPVEAVVHFLGEWALIVVLLSFSVSPLRRFCKQPLIGRCGRLSVFIVLLHVRLSSLYLEFSMAEFLDDLVERTYIGGHGCLDRYDVDGGHFNAGMAAAPAAAASLRLIIYAAVPWLLHLWLTRDGYGEPLLYTAWFALMYERVWRRRSLFVRLFLLRW